MYVKFYDLLNNYDTKLNKIYNMSSIFYIKIFFRRFFRPLFFKFGTIQNINLWCNTSDSNIFIILQAVSKLIYTH